MNDTATLHFEPGEDIPHRQTPHSPSARRRPDRGNPRTLDTRPFNFFNRNFSSRLSYLLRDKNVNALHKTTTQPGENVNSLFVHRRKTAKATYTTGLTGKHRGGETTTPYNIHPNLRYILSATGADQHSAAGSPSTRPKTSEGYGWHETAESPVSKGFKIRLCKKE